VHVVVVMRERLHDVGGPSKSRVCAHEDELRCCGDKNRRLGPGQVRDRSGPASSARVRAIYASKRHKSTGPRRVDIREQLSVPEQPIDEPLYRHGALRELAEKLFPARPDELVALAREDSQRGVGQVIRDVATHAQGHEGVDVAVVEGDRRTASR
jgi:hypothetical protein